jgi:ADP-ribose pyrophosphatase YjhB (NUDIX family)
MITCAFEDGGKVKLRHVVVRAIVEKDGKLLLEKRSLKLLEGGKWSLPSGYLDRDETAIQGIVREIKEETGWEVSNPILFQLSTLPHRPHDRGRQNIAIDFIVQPIKQTGEKDWESIEVAWIDIDKLPPLGDLAFDHGNVVSSYLKYREKPFPLPLFE